MMLRREGQITSGRQEYSSEFYERQRQGSFRSAEIVLSALSRVISFRSVVDVGCGVGTWLRAVAIHGVSDFLGVDGEYVKRAALQVSADRFLPRDLTIPLKLDRTFDLAMSLEVAEHLPPACASDFVHSLVRLAPIILFSAAIPFQGGNHHLNEQWPDYWAKLFEQHSYVPVDCIRPYVWNDSSVEWWYAQNTFVYASQEGLSKNLALADMRREWPLSPLPVVHPRNYTRFVDPLASGGFKRSLSLSAASAKNVFRKRLKSLSSLIAERK